MFYLDKEWNGVEPSDDYSVVDVSGQDVKCSCAALHNLLHTHSLLMTSTPSGSNSVEPLDPPPPANLTSLGRLCATDFCMSDMTTHHKLLLRASHAGAPLCVLVCSDQQLDQSGDGALLPQRSVVRRAESQVTDQTDCSLWSDAC